MSSPLGTVWYTCICGLNQLKRTTWLNKSGVKNYSMSTKIQIDRLRLLNLVDQVD